MRFIFSLTLLLAIFNANAQFTSVSSGTTNHLLTISYGDASTVYIGGGFGTILKSVDDGLTWAHLNSGVTEDLYASAFLNKDVGMMAGNGNVLIRTTDGGATWQQSFNSSPNINFRHLYFKDELNGYAMGADQNQGGIGVLYKTIDGGLTWTGPTLHQAVYSMDFEGDLGIITGLNGSIERTIDGGLTWTTVPSGTNVMLSSSFIVNENLMFVTGGNTGGGSGIILRSTDGGQSFQSVKTGITDFISSVNFVDEFTGYAVGGQFPSNASNIIYKTTDGGSNWFVEPSTGNRLYKMALSGDNRMLIGGTNGILLRYTADFNVVEGSIYKELNHNCIQDAGEEGMGGILVKAEPGPQFGVTDANGNYKIILPAAGTYTIQQVLDSKKLITQECPSGNQTVTFAGINEVENNVNFANEVKDCALLNVSISSSRRRRCFTSYTRITYWNEGTVAAQNAQVKVIYPKYVTPLSSSVAWDSQQDSLLVFNVGNVEAGEYGSIMIKDSVICGNEAIRGLTACTKVSISPAQSCDVPDTDWDKSSIKVSGYCQEGIVFMEILNGGSGDMASSHPYRIYRNDTLISTANFMLNSGEKLVIQILAEGNTIRLEADQHPKHPGKSRPRETVEGCAGSPAVTLRKGFVTSTPLDNLDEFVDEECLEIIDSYDPNDKQVSPAGISDNHYIYKEEVLDYLIRFQNTGSDTAYNVVVKDTLDLSLDPSTIEIIGSSHSYTWNLKNGAKPVVTFSFVNINLPDSVKNNAGSNGFIRFKINQKANNAPGTIIKNKADIYFDYNSPIVTNETMNEVWNTYPENPALGNKVLSSTVITDIKASKGFNVVVMPNPFSDNFSITIPEADNYTLSVYNAEGRKVMSRNFRSAAQGSTNFDATALAKGLYHIHITSDRGASAYWKLVKQ